MTATPSDDAIPRVHIVDSHDTSAAADDIIRALDRLGVDGTAPAPDKTHEVRAVVVLLSAAALHDPIWRARVEALRTERLVPVRVGDLADSEVPEFLRELNWVFYRRDDPGFLAQLFTGINTDASRFRDARDTRALAERWEEGDRSPDFLLDSPREVRRRIRNVVADADGSDPLVPKELVAQLAGSFPQRFRFARELIVAANEEGDEVPPWLIRPMALFLSSYRDRLDELLEDAGTTPVAYLAASRRHANRLVRRRVRQLSLRSILAAVTVAVIITTVVVTQQAVKKSNNAIVFSIGDITDDGRPDLVAMQAGASLVDSGTFPSFDGRFRIVTDALSQHWSQGYLKGEGAALMAAVILADGSIKADDYDGAIWTWNHSLSSRTKVKSGALNATYFDSSPDGKVAVLSAGSTITVVHKGSVADTIEGLTSIVDLHLAPAADRLLVSTGKTLWTVDGIGSTPEQPTKLGEWDSVFDVAQTSDGHAVALVEQDGELELVHDDGTIVDVGPAPGDITGSGTALAPDGRSFAVNVGGSLWTSTDGPLRASGVLIPGVELAMAMTSDGLVLVSDRTLGSWVADPRLGIRLGPICDGFTSTRSFVVDKAGERVLCVAASNLTVDSIAELRSTGSVPSAPAPITAVTAHGHVSSLSISDGFLYFERSDGTKFAFDAAGLSFAPDFVQPPEVQAADLFGPGSDLQARSLPTTVAVTADGSTFAIGFIDGRLVEVDVDPQGGVAPVGAWQLPDHEAVQAISWSYDGTIRATTAQGTEWQRESCAGCWKAREFVDRIADRAWLCYEGGDIDALGDTPRSAFRLRDCDAQWGDGK